MKADELIVIKDANILIDLHHTGLLGPWFGMGIITTTTDFVVKELRAGSQWESIQLLIESKSLMVSELNPEEVINTISLSKEYKVSLPDASVLELAKSKEGKLLTGDLKLRKAADRLSVNYSGVLWILDLMVDEKVITPSEGVDALEALKSKGSRLPAQEVQNRILIWKLL